MLSAVSVCQRVNKTPTFSSAAVISVVSRKVSVFQMMFEEAGEGTVVGQQLAVGSHLGHVTM